MQFTLWSTPLVQKQISKVGINDPEESPRLGGGELIFISGSKSSGLRFASSFISNIQHPEKINRPVATGTNGSVCESKGFVQGSCRICWVLSPLERLWESEFRLSKRYYTVLCHQRASSPGKRAENCQHLSEWLRLGSFHLPTWMWQLKPWAPHPCPVCGLGFSS